MDLISDLLSRITQNIGPLPTLVVMAIPFILGLIVGFFIKKALKWAIIAAIILVVATYFGLFGLTWGTLGNLGMEFVQGATVFFGLLPLGIGFIIGLILGFIFG